MPNVAVILSGCGFIDGAEIRESVISLLTLSRLKADVEIFAPDISQHHVVDHLSGEETGETRNVLVESARIARGQIKPLDKMKTSAFDALVIPGGFGVAKNLSDLAFKGPDATVLPEFSKVLNDFASAKKPIAAICISPAVLVAALGKTYHPRVTIGEDADTAKAIEAMGGSHEECASQHCVFDPNTNIVSCSAYMRDGDALCDIADGIEQCITRAVELATEQAQAA